MPSLKEIKNRISSVNSTRKITSAMKMVASSKLHHAQIMIGNMLPYESMLEHILKAFLASEVDATTVYNTVRRVKKLLLLYIHLIAVYAVVLMQMLLRPCSRRLINTSVW